jgi:hypothetical protein
MWRIGHARPVSIREIADSGVVDPIVLDELGEVLESAGNDGSSLIEALRASDDPPLSEQTIDRLEAWLISEGFIAQGEAMSRADLRARMLESARDDLDRGLLTDADIDEVLRRLDG